jgi:hypothetical protein
VDHLNKQKCKERARKPQARKYGQHGVTMLQMTVAAHAKTARGSINDEHERNAVQKPRGDSQPTGTPTRGSAPDGAIPKTLRKENGCEERQTNDDPK